MTSVRLAVLPLRIFLVVLFAILVVFQTLSLPGQFRYLAEENPDLAYLRWPLTTVSVFWVLCVQVVVVCTWKLLTLVKEDRIFTHASVVWVDAILWAIGGAWVVVAGGFLYAAVQGDDPGWPMVLLLLSVGGAVVGLLVLVMRALLLQATSLRSDLEAVI